jgi:glucokinase
VFFPVLVGDIGGTNARFALLSDAHAEPRLFEAVGTGDYVDIESAIEDVVLSATSVMPRSAVLAVAGPIGGDGVDLTNADWTIRPRDLMIRTGIGDVVLLNDFEALALALTSLAADDVVAIGGGAVDEAGPKVVLGPGTGLGVAGLIHAANLWIPVPGEGGHVALGPEQADEFAFWPHLEPETGRISAEAILSGRGLRRLYRAICAADGTGPVHDSPEALSDAAVIGSDATAVRTIETYCRLLGRVAGDLALIFMATGGVYIGGGIAPKILPALETGGFRRAFEDKAPHQTVMAAIPTSVITASRPALKGLTAFARTPGRFGVSLHGRRWRAEPREAN